MSGLFERVIDRIYRLKVPFDTVYTSVFLAVSEGGVIMVDCATTDCDVDEIILPALRDLGYEMTDIKAIVVTHHHGDHAGGLERILHYSPDVQVIKDVRAVFDGFATYPLCGHTNDMVGLFDARTGTLISSDGLQGAGVDKYRAYAENKEAYFDTLDRIRRDIRVENLVFSHAYDPWLRDCVFGRDKVLECLDICAECINK